MPFASATDILLTTAKDLTADLFQSQRNPLLPPPDTQTRYALIKINEIFSNVTKPYESTHNNLSRVPTITIKTPADLPRVPLITTAGFIDMTSTSRQIFQKNNKAKNTPKVSKQPEITKKSKPVPPQLTRPTPRPSSQPCVFPSNQRRSQCTCQPTIKLRENIEPVNFVSTPVQLPPKLQHLVNIEIKLTADPTINPLYKINAVLDAETGKLK